MSGSRAKAIRAEFTRIFDRPPHKARWSGINRLRWIEAWFMRKASPEASVVVTSEWRQAKRAWKQGGLRALEALGR